MFSANGLGRLALPEPALSCGASERRVIGLGDLGFMLQSVW
jgi:hypothetical protein